MHAAPSPPPPCRVQTAALQLWRQLEQDSGEKLLSEHGLLFMGETDTGAGLQHTGCSPPCDPRQCFVAVQGGMPQASQTHWHPRPPKPPTNPTNLQTHPMLAGETVEGSVAGAAATMTARGIPHAYYPQAGSLQEQWPLMTPQPDYEGVHEATAGSVNASLACATMMRMVRLGCVCVWVGGGAARRRCMRPCCVSRW